MKKENAVTNLSASKGKTGKTQVQKRNATGESSLSSAAIDGQRIISYQSHNNQEQYYELFNLVNSAVAVYEAVEKGNDFIFTDFNKAAEKVEKTPRERIIGRKVTEVFPGVIDMGLLDTFRRVWKTGKPEFNPAAVYKDKHLISWRENYVYKLPSGEIMAIYEDITERKQAEIELQESEDRFRNLYENATIGMYRTTPGGKVLIANLALIKMLGFKSIEEMTKRDLNKEGFETNSPRQQFKQQIEAIGEVHGYESAWKTKNGSTLYVRESARVVRDKSGKVLYYEGTVEDISERHRAEIALRENEIFLNSVIENIPNMIFVKEAKDLRFVRFNKAGEELLGFTRQLMYGKNDYDFFPPDEAEHFVNKDKETLKNRFVLDIPEEKIQTKDQGERILHTKKIPILDEKGNPKYLLGISEDITERKQSEQALLILSDTQKQLAQVDNLEDLYKLVGNKLLKLVPDSYIVFSVLDEDQQATRPVGLFGFGPIYEKLKRTFKIDPIKYSYLQKDMTAEEQRLFRSGKLEVFPGGLFALMTRKFPKSICLAGEKQLKIEQIYTQGLVYQGNYLGVIAILARSDISRFKEMIEIIIQQISITFNRIRSRIALQESEERFRGLFEDSPVSLWVEDFSVVKKRLDALRAEGVKDMRTYLESHPEEVSDCAALTKIVDVNKAGISLFKAKKKDDLLKNLSEILSPQSFKEFRQELIYLHEGKTKFSWEGKSLTMDSELIDTNLSWSVVPGYENDLSKVLVSIEDITERKRIKETLQENEERFRGLFENSPVSLWEEDFSAVKQRLDALRAEGVTDMHAYLKSHPEEVANCAALIKVLDVNKTSIELYRARDKEHLIKNLAQIVSIGYTGKFIDELVMIGEGLTRFNFETVNQAIDGERIEISISWAAAPGHENDLSKVLVSIEDITERKEAEVKLDLLITELRDLSQTEKKNRILAEALAKNVTVLNSSLKAEEVMDSIVESIGEIVPYDAAAVLMIEGNQARIVRSKGYQERGLEKWVEHTQFDLNKIKDFSAIVRNKKYKVTPNTETSKDWTVIAETAWVKSHITSPLIENSQVIGFLNLDSATPDFYTEEHAKVLMSFSEQVSTALKNARLFEDTQRRMKRMQAMTQIDLAINSNLDINISLEIVLIEAKDKLNADAVDILQVNKATGSLVFSKAKGFKTDEVHKSNFRLGTGLPGRAVMEQTLIAIPDLRSAPESFFKNMLVEREGFVSYYCAPLITKGELKGVMEIYFREPFKADQEWQEFLEMLAQQTAIAINNAELLTSLKVSNADLINAYETTLRGWVDALDMRDHETESHTRRVTELSLQLALRMGIKDSEVVNFERGALLHDIGKVGISDTILNKPGPLTDEEWVIMRQHPLNAFQLLSKSKYLIPALDIPYCHHEKWDGSGYPRGLKGEAIPLAARIFAVVDVWDALTSDRPYRKAWSQKKALDHIQEQSGKHFDPKVVSAFMALPKTGYK
jgi:PAS domain S-box-containing protein